MMPEKKKDTEKESFPSPLKLLYTAYSDARPVYSQAMEKCFEKLDDFFDFPAGKGAGAGFSGNI